MIDEIDLIEEETIDIELDNDIITLGDMLKSVYDTNNNGIVDNAEKVNNHTVDIDVPENAKFTDTIYDDTHVKQDISNLQTNKADKSEIPTHLSDLAEDSTHRTVSDTEKSTWNNKSDFSGNYNDLSNKPTIPSKTSDLTNDSGFITNAVNNLINYTLKTNTGSLIDLSIDSTNYVITLSLKDIDGNVISTDTIDLPLESVVVSGRYDNTTKKVILTLENGSEVDFSVADLVAGLQTELSPTNKLNADYIDDSNSGKKLVNTTQINTWNAKLDSSALTDYVKNTDYATDNKGGTIVTNPVYGTSVVAANGRLFADEIPYSNYGNYSNYGFIGKGTLEAVIIGKGLTTKAYVDGLVGDIDTILETLTVGNGV